MIGNMTALSKPGLGWKMPLLPGDTGQTAVEKKKRQSG